MSNFLDTPNINIYKFSDQNVSEYALNKYMANSWPVVYILKNEKLREAYIGESTNAINRMRNHLSNKDREHFDAVSYTHLTLPTTSRV